MDVRTGRIVPESAVDDMDEAEREYFRKMKIWPTPKQQRLGRVGRNDPCPCGSGKKFKKCCLLKDRT